MKKPILLLTIICIFILQVNSYAQGMYAGAEVGYAFPSQTRAFFADVNATPTFTSVTSKSYSLGEGVPIAIYGGYMFTNNIGLELNISEKFNYDISSSTTSSTPPPPDIIDNHNYTRKGNMLGFTPGIRLSTGGDKFSIYSVTGLFIGIPSATLEDNETVVTTTGPAGTGGTVTNNYDDVYTFSGNIVIGFHGAIGAMYNLSDRIGIFAEVAGDFEDWAPTERLITTYTVNGADMLGGLTTNEKQINYVDSYTTTAGSSSPGSPTQAARIYLPFSSWGISIGIHFSFGGGNATTPAGATAQ